jgi:hypothetical protein
MMMLSGEKAKGRDRGKKGEGGMKGFGRVLYGKLDSGGEVESVVEHILADNQPKDVEITEDNFLSYARLSIAPFGQKSITRHQQAKPGAIGRARVIKYPVQDPEPGAKRSWCHAAWFD